MLDRDRIVVYGGTGHHTFDDEVLRIVNLLSGSALDFSHSDHDTFPDGESGFRLAKPAKIRGRHVVIFSCPVTYKLESELKDLATACKHQYGARTVTVVLSFLRYRRQDHAEFTHEISRLQFFLRNLKHYGADNLVVCEPHSVPNTKKFAEKYGLSLFIADPTRLFADALRNVVQGFGGPEKTAVYSPDLGSVERAIALAKALGVGVFATPKKRADGAVSLVKDDQFFEVVQERYGTNVPISCDLSTARGMNLLMREDEVDSAHTAVLTAREIRSFSIATIHLLATHPVCSRGWKKKLFPFEGPPPFDSVWLGNTRPRGDGETEYEGSTGKRVEHVSIEPVIAETLEAVLRSLD
ncbi:MAG: hypothetical protein RL681_543 [Candidatus Parcubacteria bacterium]|jgi:phosphoribosylpyrophosphate synthetase